jgi:hypothetical protein
MASGESREPSVGKSYQMGDVGAGARVQQGENLSWTETSLGATPDGKALEEQFAALAKRLAEHPGLDEDNRALAVEKTQAVAEGLAHAQESPAGLRRALVDAKNFLGTSAGWAWTEMTAILKSDAAQKTIGTITEASTRAAIASLTGAG